ncbi:MAG: PHP domain-containing protein [Ruminococcaceae bacterium]|nr:PHP domain-containing protein [Oscillospiraceae bacterium]
MIQDLHSHTYYSYCGKDSPEAVIQNAIEKGLDVVGISDHYHGIVMSRRGFVYENEENKAWLHNNALKRYYEHIKTLAEKYQNDIEVWCGIEISTLDIGFTLLPDGVDVSFFDYCLIENFQFPETAVDNIFDFVTRCGCKRTGFAHMDLPAYIASKGLTMSDFFKKMKEENIFWELNVTYDSTHGFQEHQYVKDFFVSDKLLDAIRKSGMKLSVGFDGHRLEDYDADRVITACRKIEELSIPMIT